MRTGRLRVLRAISYAPGLRRAAYPARWSRPGRQPGNQLKHSQSISRNRPAEFQVDRANAHAHVAFGRGHHSCPGGPLARAEGRVSIERILDRMRNIRLSEEHHGPPGARHFSYEPTWILRGLTKLYLEFEPVEVSAI